MQAVARCLEGNIGGVRVTKAEISDQELRIQTQLRTADALTQIGNRYKEFGLMEQADAKYTPGVRRVRRHGRGCAGGWRQFETALRAVVEQSISRWTSSIWPRPCASGCKANSPTAVLSMMRCYGWPTWPESKGSGAGDRRLHPLVSMQNSLLRGEAQFGIAECFEEMAAQSTGRSRRSTLRPPSRNSRGSSINFPESGRVGEAVAKMANYYYIQKDYARAIDIFETVLNNHPDAKFLGRYSVQLRPLCLFRMDRKAEAQKAVRPADRRIPGEPAGRRCEKDFRSPGQDGQVTRVACRCGRLLTCNRLTTRSHFLSSETYRSYP